MKRLLSAIMFLTVGGVLFTGCSGDGCGPSMTVATYNAGLAMGFVDYAPERQPLIGPALSGLDVDVICVQEVWNDDSISAVIESTKAVYPHAYYELTEDETEGTEPPCTEEGTVELKACVLKNCGEEAPANLGDCALEFCAVEFGAMKPKECVNCVAANIGLAETADTVDDAINAIIGACLESAGGVYAYEGRNGVMILSRFPLTGTEFSRFDSYLNVRVLLHAIADVPDIGPVDVFCTHLTATLDSVPYQGEFESWENEQATQIDAALPWIANHEDSTTPTVVMGDMNCGPEKGEIPAGYPANFQKFTDAAFLAPYIDQPGTPCTWCGDNPLVGGGDSRIIDHVLFKNVPEGVTFDAARVMDQPVTFSAGDEDVESRYSDHYGAQVVFTLP